MVAALALLLMAAVPASAQEALNPTIAIVQPTAPINATGATPIDFTVTVSCATIVANGGNGAVVVGSDDAPAWLDVEGTTITLAPAGCANLNANLSGTGEVMVTPSAMAPGLQRSFFNLTATLGDFASGEEQVNFEVDYRSDWSVTPDITFPFTVTEDVTMFNVTVVQNSNARSMVMFEEATASAGTVSGLASQTYEPPEERIFQVTFTAPDGQWTESNVTFRTYGHYLLTTGESGDPQGELNPTWTFVNGGSGGGGGGGGGDGKDSPALTPAVFILAIAALALVMRRRGE